ncbi:MAG: hypothetical protein K8R40_13420 [Anaerolineaceae bacterium]|nr:hypothetical protein [Anaerolineaceae bacterium]
MNNNFNLSSMSAFALIPSPLAGKQKGQFKVEGNCLLEWTKPDGFGN